MDCCVNFDFDLSLLLLVDQFFFFCLNILLIVVCCRTILDGREVGIVSLVLSGLRAFGGLVFIDTGEGSASFALPLRQNVGLLLFCSCYIRLGLLFWILVSCGIVLSWGVSVCVMPIFCICCCIRLLGCILGTPLPRCVWGMRNCSCRCCKQFC